MIDDYVKQQGLSLNKRAFSNIFNFKPPPPFHRKDGHLEAFPSSTWKEVDSLAKKKLLQLEEIFL